MNVMASTLVYPGTAHAASGCLGLAALSHLDQERRAAEYRRRIAVCEPVGGVVTDEIFTLNFLFCNEDDNYARRQGAAFTSAFSCSRERTA